MGRLRLTVNEEKTHLCTVPQEYFDFLGYTFGRCYSKQTGRAYLGTRPSKKSIRRQVESIREKTDRKRCGLEASVVVEELNEGLRGWANYFKLGPVGNEIRQHEFASFARPEVKVAAGLKSQPSRSRPPPLGTTSVVIVELTVVRSFVIDTYRARHLDWLKDREFRISQ